MIKVPNKNKRYLLRKLGNKETLELSRAEVYKIVEQEEEKIDVTTQQLLLAELRKRKEELKSHHDFNYSYIEEVLEENELSANELSYLLIVLFSENAYE